MDALRLPLASFLCLRYSHTVSPPKFKPKWLRFARFDGLRGCVSHFSAENTLLPIAYENQQNPTESVLYHFHRFNSWFLLDSVHYLAVFLSFFFIEYFYFCDDFCSYATKFVCICFVICVEIWTQLDTINTGSIHFTNVLLILSKRFSSTATHLNLMAFVLLIVLNGESFQCLGFFFPSATFHLSWVSVSSLCHSMKCLPPCDVRTQIQIQAVENQPARLIKWRFRSIVSLVKTDIRAKHIAKLNSKSPNANHNRWQSKW